MPQARTTPNHKPKTQSEQTEVLTLAEAAGFRVTESELIRLDQQQNLPGRLLGDEWRFLKSALQDWLRTPLQVEAGKQSCPPLAPGKMIRWSKRKWRKSTNGEAALLNCVDAHP